MLVSIIVPCYNQGDFLADALDSVLAQEYTSWECIIVNDGSTDNSEEIALSYTKKDPRFHYLSHPNSGVSYSRNRGISECLGELILPLDGDDKISKNYLSLAVSHFIKNPDTKLVYCKARLFGRHNMVWNLPEYNYTQLLFDNMIFCSALFRKKDFMETAGFDVDMDKGLEDWEFWLRFLKPTDIVYRIPEICFFYRIKKSSRNTDINKHEQNLKALYDKIVSKHRHLYMGNENPLYIYSKQKTKHKKSIEYKIGKVVLFPRKLFRLITER